MRGPLGRLSVQIALAPVLVIALVSSAVLWRVNEDMRRQADERFAERISMASMQLDERIKNDVQLRVVGASVLAAQPGFVAALQSNDVNGAVQLAGAFMARTTLAQGGASGIRIYGPTGALLLRAEAPQDASQHAVPAEVQAARSRPERRAAPSGWTRRSGCPCPGSPPCRPRTAASWRRWRRSPPSTGRSPTARRAW